MKNQKHLRKEKNNNNVLKAMEKKLRHMVKSDVAAITRDKLAGRAASKVVKAVVNKGTQLATGSKGDTITVSHNCSIDSVKALAADVWSPSSQVVTITNSFLFPLLSTFAVMYEKFKFETLELLYEPSVSTMQAAGFVYIDMMENPDENTYESEMAMSDSGAKRARPDKPISFPIKCCKQWMYCQNGFVNGKNTLTDYAMCKVVWASYNTGLTTGTALGKIKIRARVSFMGIRMPASISERMVGSYSSSHQAVALNSADVAGTGWVPTPSPLLLGNVYDVATYGMGAGITVTQTIAGKLTFTVPTFSLNLGATVFIDVKVAANTGPAISFPAGFVGDIGTGSTSYSGPVTFIDVAGYSGSSGYLAAGTTNPADYAKFSTSGFAKNNTFSSCFTYNGQSNSPIIVALWLPVCVAYGSLYTNQMYISVQVQDYSGAIPAADPN